MACLEMTWHNEVPNDLCQEETLFFLQSPFSPLLVFQTILSVRTAAELCLERFGGISLTIIIFLSIFKLLYKPNEMNKKGIM
jgi:hypothetical protein